MLKLTIACTLVSIGWWSLHLGVRRFFKTGAGNEVSRTFDAAATGQFSGPVIAGSDTNAGAAKSNDSLAQAGAPDEMTVRLVVRDIKPVQAEMQYRKQMTRVVADMRTIFR